MNIRYALLDEDARFIGKKTFDELVDKFNGDIVLDAKVRDYVDGEEMIAVHKALNENIAKSKKKCKYTAQLLVEGPNCKVLYQVNKNNLSLESIEQDMQMFSESAMKKEKILNYPTVNSPLAMY